MLDFKFRFLAYPERFELPTHALEARKLMIPNSIFNIQYLLKTGVQYTFNSLEPNGNQWIIKGIYSWLNNECRETRQTLIYKTYNKVISLKD